MRKTVKSTLMRLAALTVFGAVAGAAIGSQVGVVGFGGGINGSLIFGPIGAVTGFLTGLAMRRT